MAEDGEANGKELAQELGRNKVPNVVTQKWQAAFRNTSYALSELANERQSCELMLELAAIADEASAGLGIQSEGAGESLDEIFVLLKETRDFA